MRNFLPCCALVAALALSRSAAAQDFSLRLDAPAQVAYNSASGDTTFGVGVLLSEDVPAMGTAADVNAFTISIAYDGSLIDATSADPAGPVAALGPEYWGVDLANQAPGGQLGVSIAAIFAFEGGHELQFGSEAAVATITFLTEDATLEGSHAEFSTALSFESLGDPVPTPNLIGLADGSEYPPAVSGAVIDLYPANPFTFALLPDDQSVTYSTLDGHGEFALTLTVDEEDVGQEVFPLPAAGLSVSMVYPSGTLSVVDVDQLDVLLDLGPEGAAFFGFSTDVAVAPGTAQTTLGVVFGFEETSTLSFEDETEVASFQFETVAASFIDDEDGASANINLIAAGNPQVRNLVTLSNGQDLDANVLNAHVDLVPEVERGFTFSIGSVPDVVYDPEDGEATFDLPVTIQENASAPGFPNQTSGFSVAISYNDALVTALDATASSYLGTPDFFGVNTDPANGPGIVIGAVFDFEQVTHLTFGVEREVLTVQFATVASAFMGDEDGETTLFAFSSDLGDPATPNSIAVGDVDRPVNTQNGSVAFVADTAVQFARSDCNGDKLYNIADGIFFLYYLFLGGGTPPCLAACNTNGDGSLGLQDAIYVFAYQFTDGPPPAEPFPECGLGNPNEQCDTYPGCD